MNTYKHIALIAAISLFASCAKNEVVEPATPVTHTDATQADPVTETTPLLDSDTPQENSPTHTTPLLDSDTPPAVHTTGGDDPSALPPQSTDAPVNGKASFAHNLESH
jgi:hypothetical protein